jgi:molybdate transport system substrate-binding protein
MAVRASAPLPDIGSVDAFRKTLLDAKSVAPKNSASGLHIKNELFRRMGHRTANEPQRDHGPEDSGRLAASTGSAATAGVLRLNRSDT